MNKKIHIDQEIVKILYIKYKRYILPIVAISMSIYIFFQFVIPQIQNFLVVKDEVNANEQILASLTQNYNTIVSIPDTDIDTQLAAANRALPNVKDFAGILTAIAMAAGNSGVAVNDYSFQVGDINSVSQAGQKNQTIQLSLSIKADIDKTKQFLTALSNQLPLSEIAGVTMTGTTTAAITINFFYSPPPKITFVDTNPLPVLTGVQKKLLAGFTKNITSQSSSPVVTLPPQLQKSPNSSTSSR